VDERELQLAWEAGRDAAAQKVEHFLDELTSEEFPKHGLCRVDGRFDSGWSANVIPVLTRWIRALAYPCLVPDHEKEK
jgi:hypothetical protein